MRPYLESAGHHQYAKAITLYLNDMMNIKSAEQEVWKQILKTPVVRRTYSRCAGLRTDLDFEQILMCAFKSIEELSHSLGWEDSQQLSCCCPDQHVPNITTVS